jgi:hypothetical protein
MNEDLESEPTEEVIYITEVAVINDEKIVHNILNHADTQFNEHGELTDYNSDFLRNILQNDLVEYKCKNQLSSEWNFEVDSFYYVKLIEVRNIFNAIEAFKRRRENI